MCEVSRLTGAESISMTPIVMFDNLRITAIPFVRKHRLSALAVGLAALCGPSVGWAGPLLGTAEAFAVLGGSATTNTGSTTLSGNYGVSPGSSLGMAGVTLTGSSAAHAGDSVAGQAQADLTSAYTGLKGLLPTSNLTGQNLGGKTLKAGVYSFATSADLTGLLILDFEGLANALFVFQTGTTLTTASGSGSAVVQIINPGPNDAVYWVVGSAATIGTNTAFEGNILALNQIALQTGATIGCGRALNKSPGPVTMDTNSVSIACTNTNEVNSNGLSGTGLGFLGGNVINLNTGALVAAAAVPEPGSLALFGFGLAAMIGFTRRRSLRPSREVTSSA